MNRNQLTTLAELREGDRFRYPSRNEAWEVINQGGKNTFVNQFTPNGKRLHVHDIIKKSDTPVVFLRHTRPLPGEDCLLQDLRDGDVFHLPDNIINEYRVIQNQHGKVIKAINNTDEIDVMGDPVTVCFVGKYQEVKL